MASRGQPHLGACLLEASGALGLTLHFLNPDFTAANIQADSKLSISVPGFFKENPSRNNQEDARGCNLISLR